MPFFVFTSPLSGVNEKNPSKTDVIASNNQKLKALQSKGYHRVFANTHTINNHHIILFVITKELRMETLFH